MTNATLTRVTFTPAQVRDYFAPDDSQPVGWPYKHQGSESPTNSPSDHAATYARYTERGELTWGEAILQEAYYLNDEFNAYRDNAARVSPITASQDALAAQAQADALALKAENKGYHATAEERQKLRDLITGKQQAERRATELQERLQALQFNQIKGDDPRLTDFWQEAMSAATENNYCAEYDRMAELLNGPRRMTPGFATVRVSFDVTVPVDDINDYSVSSDDVEAAVNAYELYLSDWTITDVEAS